MTEPLLTIGAFARATGLTAGSLRHYDEVGLLHPADVDASTGYRYYTPELVRRAVLVARMRAVGVPIDTMRAVLDGSPAQADEMLRRFAGDQAERAALAGGVVSDLLAVVTAGNSDRSPGATLRVSVDGPEVAAAIRQVALAADSDTTSPLGGVLLDLAGGSLDVVATNRHWMAVRSVPVPDAGGAARAVLGAATADALAAVLDRRDEVHVEIGDSDVFVTGAEPARFAARDVAFPDHRAVLDGRDEPEVRALVAVADLRGMLGDARRSSVELSVGGAAITSARGDEVRAVVRGPALAVTVGTALLQRALAGTVGPTVLIDAARGPCPLRLRSPHQRGFVALVMPMKP